MAPLTTIFDTFVTSPPPWLSSTKNDTQRTFWNTVKSSSITDPEVTCSGVRTKLALAFLLVFSKLKFGLLMKTFIVKEKCQWCMGK